MDNEEIAGVKFSEFPMATPGDSDEVVGLHAGDNARFSVANFVLAIRQGLANIFVPKTDVGAANGVAELDSTGKVPSSQLPPIASTAADVTYDNTQSGLTATDVQEAIDEVVTDMGDKQDTITANGILKGDGQGGVSAATAGTDYQAPLTAGTDYATPAQLADKANQSQLAYVETGTTASRTYARNLWISWQGKLYSTDKIIPTGSSFYTTGGDKNLTEAVAGGINEVNYRKIIISTSVILEISGRTAVFRSKTNSATSTDIRNSIIPQDYRPSSDVVVPLSYYNGSIWVSDGRCIRINSSTGAVTIYTLAGGTDTSLSFNFSAFCATWIF